MIDRNHKLPVSKQIKLIGINRSNAHYEARPAREADLELMRRIDELHLEFSFKGNWRDKVLTERVCRSLKCKDIYCGHTNRSARHVAESVTT